MENLSFFKYVGAGGKEDFIDIQFFMVLLNNNLKVSLLKMVRQVLLLI